MTNRNRFGRAFRNSGSNATAFISSKVDSYAGSRYSNKGVYDGTAVGWAMASLPAEKREGPFVVMAEPREWSADKSPATLSSWAWVRWKGGAHTSEGVTMPHPMNPSMMLVSARANHSEVAHVAYLDVSTNIPDLRMQVANWESGNDSGRRIAIEKVDSLQAISSLTLSGRRDEEQHRRDPRGRRGRPRGTQSARHLAGEARGTTKARATSLSGRKTMASSAEDQ